MLRRALRGLFILVVFGLLIWLRQDHAAGRAYGFHGQLRTRCPARPHCTGKLVPASVTRFKAAHADMKLSIDQGPADYRERTPIAPSSIVTTPQRRRAG